MSCLARVAFFPFFFFSSQSSVATSSPSAVRYRFRRGRRLRPRFSSSLRRTAVLLWSPARCEVISDRNTLESHRNKTADPTINHASAESTGRAFNARSAVGRCTLGTFHSHSSSKPSIPSSLICIHTVDKAFGTTFSFLYTLHLSVSNAVVGCQLLSNFSKKVKIIVLLKGFYEETSHTS